MENNLAITVREYMDRFYTNEVKADIVSGLEVYLYSLFQSAVLLALFPLIFDRIIAIRRPLLYSTFKHKIYVIVFIVACWVIAGSYSLVVALVATQNDFTKLFLSRTVYSVAWISVFCLCPLFYNIISFCFIISYLKKNLAQRSSGQTILVVNTVKAILTTFFFTVSWLPLAFSIIVFNNLLSRKYSYSIFQYIFLYMNTVTDPIMYLLPTCTIRKLVQFCRINLPGSQPAPQMNVVNDGTKSITKLKNSLQISAQNSFEI